MEFNSIKFYKEDFLDTVSFHYLILENIKEWSIILKKVHIIKIEILYKEFLLWQL
jgi:hypothetical protein